jgi:hypothetical protein
MSSEQVLIAPRSHGTRLLIAARSILLGWAALFAITYLMARPLLHWTAPLLDASWLPTAQLIFQCVSVAAAGWVVRRSSDRTSVLLFAIMLAVWNFGLAPAVNVPWLIRLFIDSIGNARYLDSLITAAATDALLFGSLIAGALLGRPNVKPISLMGDGQR